MAKDFAASIKALGVAVAPRQQITKIQGRAMAILFSVADISEIEHCEPMLAFTE